MGVHECGYSQKLEEGAWSPRAWHGRLWSSARKVCVLHCSAISVAPTASRRRKVLTEQGPCLSFRDPRDVQADWRRGKRGTWIFTAWTQDLVKTSGGKRGGRKTEFCQRKEGVKKIDKMEPGWRDGAHEIRGIQRTTSLPGSDLRWWHWTENRAGH